jgi:hypothetical protein
MDSVIHVLRWTYNIIQHKVQLVYVVFAKCITALHSLFQDILKYGDVPASGL